MPLNSCEKRPYQTFRYENGNPPSPLVGGGVNTTPTPTQQNETRNRCPAEKDQGDFNIVVEDLRNEVDNLVKRNKNFEQKLTERNQDVARMNCKLKKLNMMLHNKEQELVSQREKQAKLQKQLNDTNNRKFTEAADNREDIKAKLEKKVEELTRQLRDMDSTMNCWREENELRKQDLVATQQQLEATYEEMDEMSYKLKRYKAAFKKLKTKNAELKSQLYEMECEQAKDKSMQNKLQEQVNKLKHIEEELLLENETLANKMENLLAEMNRRKSKCRTRHLSSHPTDIHENHVENLELQENGLSSTSSDEDLVGDTKQRTPGKKPPNFKLKPKQQQCGRNCKKSAISMQSKRCIKHNPKQLNERRTVMFTVYPPSGMNVLRRIKKGGNVALVCKKGRSKRYFNSRGGGAKKSTRNVCKP